jgi:hypothetical protein
MVTEDTESNALLAKVPHVIVEGDFHRVPITTRRGKNIFKDVLCQMTLDEATQQWVGACEHCTAAVNRRTQFLAWVYVYAFYHRSQNSWFKPEDATTHKNKWPLVKLGNTPMYKEEVNQYCIWQDGFFMRELLKGKAERFGRITDRDYLVTRHGVRGSQQTQRVLEDLQEAPLSDELRDKCKELPDLGDIAEGKVRTYGGKRTETPGEVNLDDLPEEVMDGLDRTVKGFETPKAARTAAMASRDKPQPTSPDEADFFQQIDGDNLDAFADLAVDIDVDNLPF